MSITAYFASLSLLKLVKNLPGGVAQGLIWGLMALGVYITFRLLDVADLTVDGSFTTGGAVTVMLILAGVPAWAALLVAVIAGIIQTEFSRINIAEDSYAAYNQALPYLLYPILALLLVPLVAISGREFGSMARAEHRAVFENKPWSDASAKLNVSSNDNFDYSNAKASVAVVPLVVLFGMIIIMFVSFGFPAKELSSTETKMSLATAYFLGSMACVLMVAKNKIMTFVQAVGVVIEGMQKMTYMSIVLIAGFCLGNVCGSLGTAKFIVDITRGFLTPALLPFFMFVIGCIIAFATGTSHGTFGILLPLAIPISMQFEINVYIGIAAVVSGALFGDHCSPISDTTLLSATASGCDNLDHVRTQLPYALIAAGASAVGFLIAPMFNSPLPTLVISTAVMIVSFLILSKIKGEHIPQAAAELAPVSAESKQI